ncbi:MAG: hypothetical protein KAJ17_09645 [Candidatus Krumholzibacteria bacterium]|nr:hypothetical protein [Candidatus Krumholzibacteria bacterium]
MGTRATSADTNGLALLANPGMALGSHESVLNGSASHESAMSVLLP